MKYCCSVFNYWCGVCIVCGSYSICIVSSHTSTCLGWIWAVIMNKQSHCYLWATLCDGCKLVICLQSLFSVQRKLIYTNNV